MIDEIIVKDTAINFDEYENNNLFIEEFEGWYHNGSIEANRIDWCVMNWNESINNYAILDVDYFNGKVVYTDSNG